MTDHLLLEYFDELISTPEDVELFQRTFLLLAVQGKLVEQNASEEPASKLIERIERTKAQLTQKQIMRKTKPLPAIRQEEIPFELPSGWVWIRLDDIIQKLGAGSTPKGGKHVYEKEGIKFIRSQNVWNDGLRLDAIAHITEAINERMSGSVVKPKDILLNITGASIARSAVVPDDFDIANVNQHVAIIRLVEPKVRRFIHLCLISSYGFNLIMSAQVGISREGLSMRRLREFVFPIPPLAEQERIVARIEELFAKTRLLAEHFGRARTELDRLNESALARLVASETPEEFDERWAFIAEHFDLLIQAPEHIAPLRQSILELAVRGKLTRREPGDEPAKELLKRIKEEKNGKVKSLRGIAETEKPLELPMGWEWVRFDEILQGIEAGKSFLAEGRPAQSHELGVLKVSAVTWGEFDPKENKALLPGTAVRKEFTVRANDLLITRANTSELVGAVVLVGEDHPNLLLSDKTLRLKCASEMLRPYLVLALRAPWVRDAFADQAIGTSSSMRNISQYKIRSVLVAVPPLAEQERIVERVEQLLGWCNVLESQLKSAEDERQRLVESVLARVGGDDGE